ncbi:MAG: lipase family protein [Sporichthyaceae bacterium]
MSRMRPLAAAALALALALPAAAPAAAQDIPDGSGSPVSPAEDAFYAPPSPIPDVAPGTILRSRPVVIRGLGVPMPVRAWQVLYRSTDTQGRPNAVSGTVAVLADGKPDAERPLVAYNVGSHGLGPLCAPSYLLRHGVEQEEALMAGIVSRGWAIVVTDYEGSGTPGPHTYTAGPTTGRAVLDGIKAALNLEELGLSKQTPVGIWGYSEGGLASTWAAEQARDYARGVNLVGTAAGGIPVDLEKIGRRVDGTYLSGFLLAAAVGLNRAHPSMRLDELLNDEGRQAVEAIESMCVGQFATTFPFKKIADFSTADDPLGLPQVRAVLQANRLGRGTPSAPMHVYESTNDQFMPLEDVRGLVANYCKKGVAVNYVEDSWSEHLFLAGSGAYPAMNWLAGRFAGAEAPSSCAS